MFTGIRALVFDFDGTLVDASAAICHAFNSALTRFGLPERAVADIQAMIGRPLREMFRRTQPQLDQTDIDLLVAYYREAFAPVAATLSRPMPGLDAMLSHFRPRCALGIATSRLSDGAEQILGHLGCLDAFSAIIGLQDVTQAKPHPEPVQKAVAALGATPAASVMIGDVPDDMRAGRAAGTGTVGIISDLYDTATLRAAGADEVVTRLDQLIPLIRLADH